MVEDLKVGDVVQLKSGGPKMTIEQIGDFNRTHIEAKCVWFNETKRESGLFELSSLGKGIDSESTPNL